MFSRELIGCDWVEYGMTPEMFVRKIGPLPQGWHGPGWYSDRHDTILCTKASVRVQGWYDWYCWNHRDAESIKASIRETAEAMAKITELGDEG